MSQLELGKLITKNHVEVKRDGEVVRERYEVWGELEPGSYYYNQVAEAIRKERDRVIYPSMQLSLWLDAVELGLPLWVTSGTIVREGRECKATFDLDDVNRHVLERARYLASCPSDRVVSALFGTEFRT